MATLNADQLTRRDREIMNAVFVLGKRASAEEINTNTHRFEAALH